MDSYCNPVYADYHRRAFESKLWLQRKYFPGLSQELPVLNRVKEILCSKFQRLPEFWCSPFQQQTIQLAGEAARELPQDPLRCFGVPVLLTFLLHHPALLPVAHRHCLFPVLFSGKEKDPLPVKHHSLVQGGFTLGHLRGLSCPMLPFHQDFSAPGMWFQSELRVPRTDNKQESKQTTRLKAILYPTS